MGTHAAVDESSNSPGLERTSKQIIGRVFSPVRKWGFSGMKNLADKVRGGFCKTKARMGVTFS